MKPNLWSPSQNTQVQEGQKLQNPPSRPTTLGLSASVSGQQVNVNSSTPTPATRSQSKLRFGVVVNDYANRTGELTSLQSRLGTKIDTISIFKQFGHPYNKNLIVSDLQYAKTQAMTILLAWEPWNPQEGKNQSVDYLTEITSGGQDAYLRQMATDIKSFEGPVTLRFGHEMNGDWYPWGRRPQEYKRAYNYIHDVFKKEDVQNVKFMWSVNVGHDVKAVDSYYPGNEAVDLVGIDGFNFGNVLTNTGWTSFSDIFLPTYEHLTDNYQKPIIISETASTEFGGSKSAWVREMFTSLASDLPKIEEIVWFDLLKETDWRIDSSTSALNEFLKYFQP